jgi:type II secretory pathway component PulM
MEEAVAETDLQELTVMALSVQGAAVQVDILEPEETEDIVEMLEQVDQEVQAEVAEDSLAAVVAVAAVE